MKKGQNAALLLLALSILCLEKLPTAMGYGYTLSMPFNSVQMYGDRAKRSLATICVEIKPNGPLEEPYYMCKGADFPPFPQMNGGANAVNVNNGASAVTSHQQNINTAAFSTSGAPDSRVKFEGYNDKFSAGASFGQSENKHLETQAAQHQQSAQQTVNLNGGYHTQNNARTVHEQHQLTADIHFQKPVQRVQQQQELKQQYPTFAPQPLQPNQNQQQQQQQQQHQKQQQDIFSKQVQYQQFQRSQQEPVLPANPPFQPATNYQQTFQQPQQFFRPITKIEFGQGNEKLESSDSIYSDGGNPTPTQQLGGSTSSTSYSAQHTSGLGTHAAAPTYQSNAHSKSSIAVNSGGTSNIFQSSQQFKSPQHSLHDTADCGEDCGKSINQASSSDVNARDGPVQYAAKSVIHSSNSAGTQHGYVQQSHTVDIPNEPEQSAPPVPGTRHASANIARTSSATSLRYGTNGAPAFSANDGLSVSNVGPNDTPPLSPALLRPPMPNARYYARDDAILSARRNQAAQRPHLHRHNQQLQRVPPSSQLQNFQSQQRYRSMIDDEVLQMPNWGFSSDELDLYRNMSDEEEDSKSDLGRLALPPPQPALPPMTPLQYLDDPVMRAFYSSLEDVGPAPRFMPPTYARPPARRPQYQPVQGCPYAPQPSPPPQYFNYNPCPPQREYSFQPVFIALPCYGQSGYPNLGSPAPTSVSANYDHVSMANPLADPLTRLLTIGNPITHFLTSPQTQALTTPPAPASTPPTSPAPQMQPIAPSQVRTSSAENESIHFGSKSEKIATFSDEQKSTGSRLTPSTTAKPQSTKFDSNESSELFEESTPTVSKTSQTLTTSEDDSVSVEMKTTTSEKPTIVKFDTSLADASKTTTTSVSVSTSVEPVVAANPPTTPAPADFNGESQMGSEMSTTFKSLIATARKLAKMVTTSQEEDDVPYKDEISTPRPAPKKVRHAPRSNGNGSGGNKRRYYQQQQQQAFI